MSVLFVVVVFVAVVVFCVGEETKSHRKFLGIFCMRFLVMHKLPIERMYSSSVCRVAKYKQEFYKQPNRIAIDKNSSPCINLPEDIPA